MISLKLHKLIPVLLLLSIILSVCGIIQVSATEEPAIVLTRYVQSMDIANKKIGITLQIQNNTNTMIPCTLQSELADIDGTPDSTGAHVMIAMPGTQLVSFEHSYKAAHLKKVLSIACVDANKNSLSNLLKDLVTFTQTPTKLTLNTAKCTLFIAKKQTKQLTYQLSPINTTDPGVSFTVSDTNVATVSTTGLITPKAPGKTLVTVMTKDRSAYAQCEVTVYSDVTRLSLNQSTLFLKKGSLGEQLTAKVTPADAPDKTVTYTSSNTKIVKVDAKGIVTYVGAGQATVTATTGDGAAKAVCKVTAVNAKLNNTSVILDSQKNKTFQLIASTAPNTAPYNKFTFKSSNSKVAKVNTKGKITYVKPGTATITATSANGKIKLTCKVACVQVNQNASSVTLDNCANKTFQFTTKISPNKAPYNQFSFKSSNPKVAKVNAKGKITYVGPGTATITATAANGKIKRTCKVTCVQVKLNRTSLSLGNRTGKTFQLTVKATSKKAPYNQFTFKSSNSKVAKVNAKGKVTFVKPGTATIKAISANGKIKLTCKVACVQVKLNRTSVTLGSVNTPKFRLKPTVTPNKATYSAVTYKSSNTKVVKVSSKGLIQYVGPGNATVTVFSADGSAKKICKVTAVGVTMSKSKLYLGNGTKPTYRLKATLKNASKSQTVTFKSSHPKIAKVSKNGNVRFMSAGTATITATTKDGIAAATCVVDAVSITPKKSSVTLGGGHGTSYAIETTVVPNKAAHTALLYESNNPQVAKVNSQGVITWVTVGKATVTVKTKNGVATAKIAVTNLKLPQSVNLNKQSVNMWDYGQYQLKATANGITKPQITWHTSNPNVATVSNSGIVYGISKGKAVITAQCGKFSAKCTVNVYRESDYIGSTAAYFESKDNPGVISGSGTGKCYGCFQLYAGSNGPKSFYEWLIESGYNTAIGNSLKTAHKKDGGKDHVFGKNFDAKWKELAGSQKEAFRSCQMAYTIAGHYQPLADRLAKELDFYVSNYGLALKSAVLSRAVQHGIYGAFNRFEAAFNSLGGFQGKTEKQLIQAIYKECGKVVSKKPAKDAIAMTDDSDIAKENNLVGKYMKYYYDCSPSVQAGVWQRLNVTEPEMLYDLMKNPPVKITPQ